MSTIVNNIVSKDAVMKFNRFDTFEKVETYYDTTTGSRIAIDLTDWKFEFILKSTSKIEKTYSIDSGIVTSDFLKKIGTDKNTLDWRLMWEDIRSMLIRGNKYVSLSQVVTDDNNRVKKHINWTIDYDGR